MVSDDLSWSKHYTFIIAHAYKVLGLIRRTFSSFHCPSTGIKLYISLVRSQLLYCTQLWCPYLLKDIENIERMQRHVTKYILHDYTSSYRIRLLKLKLLPLMYLFKLQDILALNLLRNLPNSSVLQMISLLILPVPDQDPTTNLLIYII